MSDRKMEKPTELYPAANDDRYYPDLLEVKFDQEQEQKKLAEQEQKKLADQEQKKLAEQKQPKIARFVCDDIDEMTYTNISSTFVVLDKGEQTEYELSVFLSTYWQLYVCLDKLKPIKDTHPKLWMEDPFHCCAMLTEDALAEYNDSTGCNYADMLFEFKQHIDGTGRTGRTGNIKRNIKHILQYSAYTTVVKIKIIRIEDGNESIHWCSTIRLMDYSPSMRLISSSTNTLTELDKDFDRCFELSELTLEQERRIKNQPNRCAEIVDFETCNQVDVSGSAAMDTDANANTNATTNIDAATDDINKLVNLSLFDPANLGRIDPPAIDPPAMFKYERLLDDKEFRYTILPLKYHDIWDMYKQAQAAFWTPSEIDLSKDLSDFQKMSIDEQHYIKHVLSFFATSDTIVNMNLVEHMMTNVKIPEANYFYVFQMAIENIHSETYNLLIDTYVTDPDQKALMFDAASRMECVKNKVAWCEKYIDNDQISFAERLIASVAVEGIFFSSSFAALFWLKKRGLMPGLTFSNELISRDEALHCQFATLLYNKYINNKLDHQKIYEIIESAVAAELYFVQKSLPVSVIGMNSDDMQTYVKFVADYWLIRLGLAPLYQARNPFSFMENISMDGKTNFFEKKVAEYSKYGVNTSFTAADMTFDINEDF